MSQPGRIERAVSLLDFIASMSTYDEALAEAGGDPDREQNIREDYMQSIEDTLSGIIVEARDVLR